MSIHTIHRSITARHVRATVATLCASAALSLLATTNALAQTTVYDSTSNPSLPAATLDFVPSAGVSGNTDDYQTTLAGTSDEFLLTGLSFYGGPIFTGDPNGVNNVLSFRFLNQFGGIPDNVVEFDVAFQESGSFLYDIEVGENGIPANAFVPTNGIFEITTLENSGAVGTWAFSSTPPTVGTNNAPQAGVRAFALRTGASNVIPEPSSVALMLAGAAALPLLGIARRRRKS